MGARPPASENSDSSGSSAKFDGSSESRERNAAAERTSLPVDATTQDYLVAARAVWGPLMFQAAKCARDMGVLAALREGPKSPQEVSETARCSYYAARVLLEGCSALELVVLENGAYRLTPAGKLVLDDAMTTVNMNFVHDVCYQGAFFMRESLETSSPVGLHKTFGDQWPTIYPALTHLPQPAQSSWFRFDHFYSDPLFRFAINAIERSGAKSVLDVGGNTGRFAMQAAKLLPVTILDHAAQLEVAKKNAKAAGVEVNTHPIDLLDHSQPFPKPFDAVWMSQLLDCFGEDDIVHLLERGRAALSEQGRIWVLETFWDRQPQEVARFNVQATSLYFTCMANGTSRMYHSQDLIDCGTRAGLKLLQDRRLGPWHTLLSFGV